MRYKAHSPHGDRPVQYADTFKGRLHIRRDDELQRGSYRTRLRHIGYDALYDCDEVHQNTQTVIDKPLRDTKPDKDLYCRLRLLELGKAPAGLDHTDCEEQDEESRADCTQNTVDGRNNTPDSTFLKGLR